MGIRKCFILRMLESFFCSLFFQTTDKIGFLLLTFLFSKRKVSAQGETRTRTELSLLRILSPVCLPIPPPGRGKMF